MVGLPSGSKNNLPECDSFSINKTQETNPSTDGNLTDTSLSLGEEQNKKIIDATLVNSINNRQEVEDKDNIYLYIDITVILEFYQFRQPKGSVSY